VLLRRYDVSIARGRVEDTGIDILNGNNTGQTTTTMICLSGATPLHVLVLHDNLSSVFLHEVDLLH
jgi:hypothetical protein